MTEEQKPVGSLDILVIDDEALIGLTVGGVIEDVGDKATVVTSGQAGIDEYVLRYEEGQPYDAVLTDLRMPRVTGVDVIKAVKKLSPETYVYVITGNEANEEYERLSNELGELKPDGVIGKPFQDQTIRDILNTIRLQKYGPENLSGYQPPSP